VGEGSAPKTLDTNPAIFAAILQITDARKRVDRLRVHVLRGSVSGCM